MKFLLLKNTYELVTVSLLLVLPLLRTTEQTHSYYVYRKELPEIVVFSVWASISIFLAVFQAVLYCYHKKHQRLKSFDWFTRTVIEPIIENVFSAMLEKSRENGKRVYGIFNYKLPEKYKYYLFVIINNLIGAALIQFIDDFVFEESYSCNTDPDLACFPKFPNMSTPRLNCSNASYLEENNINSVICYRLALRLGQATGSAIGIVATTALIFYPINYILIEVSQKLLKCLKKPKSCHCCLTGCCCLTSTSILQFLIAGIIIAPAVMLTIFQYQISSTEWQQRIIITKNICITYTLAYSTIFFPWCLFVNKDELSYEQI